MSREIMQQALDDLKQIHQGNMTPMAEINWNKAIAALEAELAKPVNEFNPDWDQQAVLVERIRELEAELAKPEPIYVMGNYAGEGKVVSASFGLPKGAFEFAPYTGAGEASKIKHSLEPQPEQEPEIVRRVKRYMGKRRESVGSPHITARECIALANWIDSMLAAPPRKEWVSLSDTEINKIVDLNTSDDGGFDIFCDGFAVAHIVCAKLKELNK